MDIRDFALSLLTVPTLEAKLLDPGVLADTPHPASAEVPAAPARPDALRFPARGEAARVPFPSVGELERDERSRGLVLHFFANHELLAMELMALALLRFPEAPASFRAGLVATIKEEQGHLRLYMQRMRAFGVDFGAVPVNRFFWDAIADTPSPRAFLAQMSLTLEQANLDFSRHYRDLFARIGDTETAAVLDLVYREEIGHVKHGVVWMARWREPADASDWQDYVAMLPPSLTPSRAKGIGFDAEARRAAGLSEGFIAELAVYNHSKGRPPIVYAFNPGCEDEIANGRGNYVAPRILADLAHDLASLMMFVAKADDVVLTSQRPAVEHLAQLQAAGFELPQIVVEADAKRALDGRLAERFAPWGASPAALARYERLHLQCRQPFALPPSNDVFKKSWSAMLHARLSPATAPSTVCMSRGQVDATLAAVHTGAAMAVVKAPLGSSGRHMHRVGPNGPEGTQSAWIDKILAAQGAVVVEPWQAKVADLSAQIVVAPDGVHRYLGVTRFLTDARGQYIGHVLGRMLDDLPAADIRTLHEDVLLDRLESTAQQVALALHDRGYTGPAGVDAFLYREADGGRLRLRPIVEINPRYTMGRVALGIGRRVHPSARALWLHVPVKHLKALGYKDAGDFAAELTARYPLATRNGQIDEGALATNDPAAARVVLSLLIAGRALADLRESLLGSPGDR